MRYILLLLSFSAQAQEPANDPRQTLVNAGKEERSLLKELSEIDQKLSQLQLEKQSLEGQKSDLEIRKQKNQIDMYSSEIPFRVDGRRVRRQSCSWPSAAPG